VPEDSRVFRVRRLWFTTSDRLKPGSSPPERPGLDITTSNHSLTQSAPTRSFFCTLSCPFLLKERDKAGVSTIGGGTRAGCVRPWLTRNIV